MVCRHCYGMSISILFIAQFMDKKKYLAPFIIDKVKGTFGKWESSHSESNHSSVKSFVIRNVDGIHGAMKELIKHQKCLMLKNNHEIAQRCMELQVINQDFKAMRSEMECFLFNISSFICFKGYELIKKFYHTSLTVIYIENSDGSFYFPDDSIVLNNRQKFCSYYISTTKLMQCKHIKDC